MARIAKPLAALQIRRLHEPGYRAVGHVRGLHIQVSASGTKSWVLRVTVGKKRRELGLGSYPEVELAAAVDKAREALQQVREGIDPVVAKREAKSQLLAAQTTGWTFDQCVDAFIAEHEAKWTNRKHAAQWGNTLKTYASPTIGKMLARHVQTEHIKAILREIWITKSPTASRLRGRMEQVLDWATISGYREGPNPARWQGHLALVFASRKRVRPVKHHEYVPADEMQQFMIDLAKMEGIGARALEFLILTAVRSANVRFATWAEIDLEAGVWTIPGTAEEGGTGQRMKAGVELRVPLSSSAIIVLESIPRIAGTDLIFPGRSGKPMSDMTLGAVLKRMKVTAKPHGFRSSFKTWAADSTTHAREVIEAALGHSLKDKVEAAYMRGNWFDKRKQLMSDWATFLKSEKLSKVVEMPRRAA